MVKSRVAVAICVLAAGALALASRGPGLESLQLVAVFALLGYASWRDLRERIIPNGCIVALACVRAACLAGMIALGSAGVRDAAWSAAGCAGLALALGAFVLVAQRVTGRAGMGGGDVKLYAASGLYLGFEGGLLVVFLSCIMALVAAAALRVSHRPGAREDARDDGLLRMALPFGPFISLSWAIVALVMP